MTASSMITFSGVETVMHCAASAALPQHTDSGDARRSLGTWRHDYLAMIGAGLAPEAALAAIPEEYRAVVGCLQLDGLPLGGHREHEVAVAVDVVAMTARRLKLAGPRAYVDIGPHEIPGTIDVLGLPSDRDVVELPDWKSEHDRIPHPREAWQLRCAALATLLMTNRSCAEVSWVRLRDDGGHWIVGPATVDQFDVAEVARDLVAMLRRVEFARRAVAEGRLPIVHQGPWCGRCKALLSCPASLEEYARISAPPHNGLQPWEMDLRELVRRDPPAAREDLKRAEMLVDAIKTQLVLHAREVGGIRLANGRMYGPHEVTREVIDGPTAYRVAAATWPNVPGAAEAAVDMRGTKTGLERAARLAQAAGAVKTVAAAKRALLAAVEAAGGVTLKVEERVEEYDAPDGNGL